MMEFNRREKAMILQAVRFIREDMKKCGLDDAVIEHNILYGKLVNMGVSN